MKQDQFFFVFFVQSECLMARHDKFFFGLEDGPKLGARQFFPSGTYILMTNKKEFKMQPMNGINYLFKCMYKQ
jgi:hypothetical protein